MDRPLPESGGFLLIKADFLSSSRFDKMLIATHVLAYKKGGVGSDRLWRKKSQVIREAVRCSQSES